jgi:hypothetical protein
LNFSFLDDFEKNIWLYRGANVSGHAVKRIQLTGLLHQIESAY